MSHHLALKITCILKILSISLICTFTQMEDTECGASEAHALGMESGDIKNNQLTASSFYSRQLRAREGRLNNDNNWSTKTENPRNPWIQVDLLRSTIVTGIITQGSTYDGHDEWVTHLRIQFRDSENTWMYILESGQRKVRTFTCF